MINVVCPYCAANAEFVTGRIIYPNMSKFHKRKFYLCKTCQAYVGCHEGSEVPLGRLANKRLRNAKMEAHAVFDPIWKSGVMTRSAAYSWLAKGLCIPDKDCHIGMFDEELCNRVVKFCMSTMSPC